MTFGMRIGLWPELTGLSLGDARDTVRTAIDAGFDTVWTGEIGGWDPLALIGGLAPQLPPVGWGTAVVRTYPRHPLALAAQALTTQALAGGRLRLGVGPSHAVLVEGQYGYPVRSTRPQHTRVPRGAAGAPARRDRRAPRPVLDGRRVRARHRCGAPFAAAVGARAADAADRR